MPKKSNGVLTGGRVILQNSDESRDLYNQSRFGEPHIDGTYALSTLETLYLLEKKKLVLLDGRKQELDYVSYLKRVSKGNKKIWIRYSVYKDLRDRGYTVKTALKFGAEFRVYDRGVKPGEDHAKWIVFPVYEGDVLTWYEFAAKNRVAHSTKKRLMLGITDDESSVTYYEVKWMRP